MTSSAVIRLRSVEDARERDVHIQKRQTSDSSFYSVSLQDMPDITGCDGRVFGVCHMRSSMYIGCTSMNEHTLYLYDTHTLQLRRQVNFTFDQEGTPFGLSCYDQLNLVYILTLAGPNFGSHWSVRTVSPDDPNARDSSKILIDNVEMPIRVYVTARDGGKLVVLSTYKISEYSMDGALLSVTDSPVKSHLKYDVMLLTSGNYIVTNINRQQGIGDVSEINSTGQIIGSYKTRCTTSCVPLDLPKFFEFFRDDLYFVSDWKGALDEGGSMNLIRGDLTEARVLAKGKQHGIEFPQEMSYDPESKLLIVAMLFDRNIRVFRVNN